MAATTVPSALVVQKWQAKYLSEYIRAMQFRDLMGTGINKPIYITKDLGNGPGKFITIPFVLNLSNNPTINDDTLVGNEENLLTYGHQVEVFQYRNAVLIGKYEEMKTPIDMPKAAREKLNGWSSDLLREHILDAASSANVDGTTIYASCTEAEKDAWLDANTDRVLFGTAVSNLSTTAPAGGATYDHSGSLANVDSSNDTLGYAELALVKRLAKLASPKIMPLKVDGMGEWYVMLASSYPFRDLGDDLATLHSNGMPRSMSKNPLWVDGDLQYKGHVVKEVEEIGVISDVGAAGIDVGPCYTLGQGAIGIAWGEMPMATRRKEDDYGNQKGVGIAETRGQSKLMANEKQYGLFTGYFAGVADT